MSIPEKELSVYFEGVLVISQMLEYIDKSKDRIIGVYNVDIEKEEYDKNNVGEVMLRELERMRIHIRFEMLKDYIQKFIVKNVNSFDDLLQYGREILLYQYNNYKDYDFYIDSGTGICPSLFNTESWPILQMIELNNYMFTHASTNYPTDSTFQSMFLHGYIRCSDIGAIRGELDKTDLIYKITLNPEFYEPYGMELKEWKDQMCDLSVESPNIKDRDLYLRILEIFKKQQLKQKDEV